MKNRLIALLVLFTVTFFVSSAQSQTTARKFEAGKNTFLLDGTICGEGCRIALYAYPASLLGTPYRDVQSVGNEYDLYLYFLEYP